MLVDKLLILEIVHLHHNILFINKWINASQKAWVPSNLYGICLTATNSPFFLAQSLHKPSLAFSESSEEFALAWFPLSSWEARRSTLLGPAQSPLPPHLTQLLPPRSRKNL